MNLTTKKNWKTVKLGELADVKGGKRLPLGSALVSIKTEHPYIRVTDIQDGKVKKEQLQFVPNEVFKSISRYIVDANDVIISIVGSVGFVAFIDEDLHKASLTENCVRITEYKNNVEPKFIFYYLISRLGQHDIQSKTVGSTQPKLPIYNIRNIEIPLPSLDEQKEIAGVLGCLDDKIELLRKENKTLEEIAQTLFKRWFVNFNFPSATGKMIDSELGKIPEGWRVGKLGEVGDIVCGKTPSKSEQKYFDGEVPFIKIPDMHNQMYIFATEDSLTEAGAGSQKNKYIPEDSLCVSCIATVGLVSITTQDSQTNQQINSIVPSSKNILEYLYFVLNSKREDLQMIGGGGSATLNVNTGVFSSIEIVLPKNEVLDMFHEASASIFQKIKTNSKEIQTLSKLRDELLNKIFSN